jgi:pimeloyl-ACP methyl ester carboxylesterase
MRIPSARLVGALAALTMAGGLVACTNNPPPPTGGETPVIFVHGLLGSGAQYRSQAQRWASNGFPKEKVRAFNYNTAVTDASGLDALVNKVMAEFNVSKVNLVGHSLGTFVTNNYVSAHAGKVNRFVLVDGAGCPSGNGSCLAIRAASLGQTHVESSISAESFAQQYQFFTGRAPSTTAVVPEAADQVKIAGYALNLQTNTPAVFQNAEVWPTDAATGARHGTAPAATFSARSDGSWGPVAIRGGQTYEIAAPKAGGLTSHYYFEPFARSTDLVHLITSPSTSGSGLNTTRGPNHSSLVVSRQREFWRSHGARNDTLTLTTGGQTVNVFQKVTGDVIGVHIHDGKVSGATTPGVSSLDLLDYFKSQAFQTGVDVYLPAANPPNATITVADNYRGTGTQQRVAVRNWPSSTDAIEVELNDYVA